MKNYLVSAVISVVSVVIVLAGFALFHSSPVVTPPVGSIAGPDVYVQTFFHNNVTVGGNDFATSSVGTATYTAASFVGSRVIEHIAASALTVTTPTNAALSAAGFLPNVGDTSSLFIHASTTKITLAGGTGVILNSASSTKDVLANTTAELRCVRLSAAESRNINCLLTAAGI